MRRLVRGDAGRCALLLITMPTRGLPPASASSSASIMTDGTSPHRQDNPTGRPRHNRQGRTRTALAQLRRRSAACRPGSTRAFPSWFMRITCDRRGKDLMRTHG